MPLRVIYRRALEDGDLAVNPCTSLRLPAVRGRRERIAAPDEAQRLLDALPDRDRAIWATALYAGLRRGELMALRWEEIDLAAGVIRVERSYDDKGHVEIEPKSRAGRRTVPVVEALRDILVDHRARLGRDEGLVFGSTKETPFQPSNLWRRAQTAWKTSRPRPDRPPRGTPHVRVGPHRRRRQRKGDHDLHGPRVDPDDVRPLRQAHARLGARGRSARRRLSHSRYTSGRIEQLD